MNIFAVIGSFVFGVFVGFIVSALLKFASDCDDTMGYDD